MYLRVVITWHILTDVYTAETKIVSRRFAIEMLDFVVDCCLRMTEFFKIAFFAD